VSGPSAVLRVSRVLLVAGSQSKLPLLRHALYWVAVKCGKLASRLTALRVRLFALSGACTYLTSRLSLTF